MQYSKQIALYWAVNNVNTPSFLDKVTFVTVVQSSVPLQLLPWKYLLDIAQIQSEGSWFCEENTGGNNIPNVISLTHIQT